MNEEFANRIAALEAEYYEYATGVVNTRKFAEAIIRECANLPFKATGEVTTIGEIAVSNLILRHFGVEG